MNEMFWSKVDVSAHDKCWDWQAGLDSRGYGNFRDPKRGKGQRAHRIAYELVNNVTLPSDSMEHCILHICDNRKCCNPSHLKLGSHAENMADMKAKGRRKNINSFERNGRAKLTLEQVKAIRGDVRGKILLSREYNVSPAQIQRIRAGKQWLMQAEK